MIEYDKVLILTQAEYDTLVQQLKDTGMFWEFYPEGVIQEYRGRKVLIDG